MLRNCEINNKEGSSCTSNFNNEEDVKSGITD